MIISYNVTFAKICECSEWQSYVFVTFYLDADATLRKYICKTTFLRPHELGSRTKCIGHHPCSGTSCRLNLAPEAIRTATQPTDALRPAPVPMGKGGSYAGVTQSPPAFQNAFTSIMTVSVRKYSSGFCVPAQLRDAEIVKRGRTIEAVRGYSMGPVFRTRTTLPEKGVANVAKKGRSNPFSLYSSMTCASSPRK